MQTPSISVLPSPGPSWSRPLFGAQRSKVWIQAEWGDTHSASVATGIFPWVILLCPQEFLGHEKVCFSDWISFWTPVSSQSPWRLSLITQDEMFSSSSERICPSSPELIYLFGILSLILHFYLELVDSSTTAAMPQLCQHRLHLLYSSMSCQNPISTSRPWAPQSQELKHFHLCIPRESRTRALHSDSGKTVGRVSEWVPTPQPRLQSLQRLYLALLEST